MQRDDAVQKHFERHELGPILAAHGFVPVRIGRIYYPWAKEGLRKPRSAKGKGPWDWACLARREAGASAVAGRRPNTSHNIAVSSPHP